MYSVDPEGRSSHPLGYPIEWDPCSVLDHVLSGSLRGLNVAELREREVMMPVRSLCFVHVLEVRCELLMY